jgi:excisionase family DNA binding protein
LERVDAILENKQHETTLGDRRLLTLAAAATVLGVSRQTVFRMSRDGRLPVVETRAGRFRVPSYALTALLKGGAK